MDSAAIPSLTSFLDGIDRWAELAPLLPVLVALEIVLSADNAVALAAITRGLSTLELQRKALNIGILIALILRVLLILMAQWVLKFWFIKLLAAIYLLALFGAKLLETIFDSDTRNEEQIKEDQPSRFIFTVIILAFTDLAFSIDSVAAAVAISDQLLLVITGALIGVIALRFTSGLFISFLSIYQRLELAGYIAVGLVGVKLLLLIAYPNLVISEWVTLITVFLLFIWGFSKKKDSFIV